MSLQTIAIRHGEPEELAKISSFWLAMFEEVGNHCEADFFPDWRERFEEYFRRRMACGQARFFVAVDGGEIVATAGAMVRDGYPAQIHGIRIGYIFGVRVEPSHRRRGLAERLTREAIAFLEEAACWRIRLHASRFGRRVYERLGFVPTNEMEITLGAAASSRSRA